MLGGLRFGQMIPNGKGEARANDRNRMDEQYSGPAGESRGESGDDRVRNGIGEEVRGVTDEGDEEFEDSEELEEDEDGEESF